MPSKVSDEITYSFPNGNDCTVEVWELISNFIPDNISEIGHRITTKQKRKYETRAVFYVLYEVYPWCHSTTYSAVQL